MLSVSSLQKPAFFNVQFLSNELPSVFTDVRESSILAMPSKQPSVEKTWMIHKLITSKTWFMAEIPEFEVENQSNVEDIKDI